MVNKKQTVKKGNKRIFLLSFYMITLACRGGFGAILIGFLHIFLSTSYPISHKIILKCPFMQTALALQNQAKMLG